MKNATICIYCLGEYGIRTYYKLKEAGVQVDYFGDQNDRKQGYVVDGVYCLSYKKVLQLDKDISTIIVAIKEPDELVTNFKNAGFRKVYDKDQAVKILCNGKVQKQNPLDQVEKISLIKDLLTECFYNQKLGKSIGQVDKCFENIMLDYLKRTVG